MAAQTSWKRKSQHSGTERSLSGTGALVESTTPQATVQAFQAPDKRDVTTANLSTNEVTRSVYIGTTRYTQAPAGTGPWRKSTVAALSLDKGALSGVSLSGDLVAALPEAKLGEETTCGQSRCYTLIATYDHETGAAAAKATTTLQVDRQTFLVLRVTIQFAYADGKSFQATIDLSDYGVPNDIKPPI